MKQRNARDISIKLDYQTVKQSLEPVSRAIRPYRETMERSKWYRHLRTINHHRRLVRQYCFRVGLYRQGLMHDLSKYSPVEFLVGAKYFQGDQSPNNAERVDRGVSLAWLHHKGRNKHHFEYWIDYAINRQEGDPMLTGMEMPVEYIVEMFCDRVAASKTYRGSAYRDSDPWDYYIGGYAKVLMHPHTRELLSTMLKMLAEEGEDATFAYIREEILHR